MMIMHYAERKAKHMNDLVAHATLHSLDRMKERFGTKNERASERLISLALERGVRMHQYRSRFERTFLAKLCKPDVEPIIYQGFIFLFNLKTGACITLFRAPKQFNLECYKSAVLTNSQPA